MFDKFKTAEDENASGDFFVILSSTSSKKDLGSLIRGMTLPSPWNRQPWQPWLGDQRPFGETKELVGQKT